MFRLLAVLAILIGSAARLPAEEIRAVNLAGLNGTYLLTVNGDQVKVVPLKLYSVSPTPDPDPTPSTLTERGKAARDAALKATSDPERVNTTQMLALLYAELAKRVESGQIKGVEQITAYTKASADVLLDQRKVAAAWQPFRDLLAIQWTRVLQDGGTDADFGKLLNEVSDGLSAAAPEPQAVDLQKMIEIILMILELIQKLFPQGM